MLPSNSRPVLDERHLDLRNYRGDETTKTINDLRSSLHCLTVLHTGWLIPTYCRGFAAKFFTTEYRRMIPDELQHMSHKLKDPC